MRTLWCLTLLLVTGTGGDLAAAYAMKQTGEVVDFTPSAIMSSLTRAFRLRSMWVSLGLQAVAFFSLLVLLSWEDVSVAVPATALSYVIGAVGARFFLSERLSAGRWAGIALICSGVLLVLAG
jgi:drug/metabolite transporter (DMT)-like permease